MNQAPGQDSFDTKLREALANPANLPAEFKNYMVQYIAQNPVPLQAIIAPSHNATGLGDAIQGTRYVGATTSGSPTTGYFKVGDFVIDQSGDAWVCTASGDPGTWVDLKGTTGSPAPDSTLALSGSTTLSSGTAAALTATADTYVQGPISAFSTIPSGGASLVLTFANFAKVIFTIIIDWPAAAYDRYIEAVIANPFDSNYTTSPRLRGSLTPDSDRQVLSFLVWGQPSPATTVTIQGFQSSGSDKLVNYQLMATAVPTTLA